MAAGLVQHDQHQRGVGGFDALFQPQQQSPIEGTIARQAAQGTVQVGEGVGRFITAFEQLTLLQPAAHGDARFAKVVAAPLHIDAMAEQVAWQRFLGRVLIHLGAMRRQHAGQRRRGVAGTGTRAQHLHRQAAELRVGGPRVAVEREVRRAGGFTDHQHDHALGCGRTWAHGRCHARVDVQVGQGRQGPVRRALTLHEANPIDHIGPGRRHGADAAHVPVQPQP